MEALSVSKIPTGPQWQYEPKWDGFRCLVFIYSGEVDLRSKAGRPLGRHFPELVEAVATLEAFAQRYIRGNRTLRLSRATRHATVAQGWLRGAGGDMHGVVGKRLDLPYQSGERGGMQKGPTAAHADCVVGGFRYGSKATNVVGSLRALTPRVEALITPPGFTGRAPGGPSRWSTERSGDWHPLRPGQSWRSNTITSAAAAPATGRSSCAGVPTKRPRSARWTRCNEERAPRLRPGQSSR
jgi:hypothetical protein